MSVSKLLKRYAFFRTRYQSIAQKRDIDAPKTECGGRLVVSGLLALLLTLAIAPASNAASYFVATNGNDSNTGTLSAPFRTLNKGVRVLKPGDTLFVRAGTYVESLFNVIPGGTSWSSPVTLSAYVDPANGAREMVVVKPPTGSYRVLNFGGSSAAYIVIDGFVLDGTNIQYDVIKIEGDTGAHHIRIINCEIKNGPSNGILGGTDSEFINLDVHHNGSSDFNHGLYLGTPRNLVENSRIYNNAGWGIHIYNETSATASNNIVRNNKIYNNSAVGPRGSGMILGSGSGNSAYNNLVWGNANGIDIMYGASNTKVYNNTAYANKGYGISIAYAANTAVINNIAYQNLAGQIVDSREGTSGTILDRNLTNSDPKFVDPLKGDFRLQSTSPAVNAGTSLSEVTKDHVGVLRPQGSAYDIGAYEYSTANQNSTVITVDSTFAGYNTATIDDEVIDPKGGTGTTWASAESMTDHWILLSFPTPKQLNRVTIHWAFNNAQGKFMTSQRVDVQHWNGTAFQTVATLVYPGTDVPASSATFPAITTSQLRLFQPAGYGNLAYNTVFWITEVDYDFHSAPSIPSAPSNLLATGGN